MVCDCGSYNKITDHAIYGWFCLHMQQNNHVATLDI